MAHPCKLLVMMDRQLSLFCLLVGVPLFLFSQSNYEFQVVPQAGGFTTNTVRNILEDRNGFFWLASDNGLSRFDGQEFLRFRFDPNNPNSISANQVSVLCLDQKNNLWIGTDLGLNRMDLATGQIEQMRVTDKIGSPGPYNIKALLEDKTGNIWVGTQGNGLVKLTPNGEQNWMIQHFAPDSTDNSTVPFSDVHHLIEDDFGDLWLGSNGGLIHLDKEKLVFSRFSHPILRSGKVFMNNLAKDDLGQILFTVNSAGVFYLDPAAEQPRIAPFFDLDFQLPESSASTYNYILQVQGKQFLLGTADRLLLIDSTKRSFRKLKHAPARDKQRYFSKINTIYESQAGEIWVGYYGGLSRQKQFRNGIIYSFFKQGKGQEHGLGQGQIRTIVEDSAGYIWIGYLDTGLERFMWDEAQQQLIKQETIQYDSLKKDGLVGNNIIQLLVDRKGFIWIGSNKNGLNKLDPKTGRMETFQHDPQQEETLSGNFIWGLCEDQEGYIWVADFLEGLNRLDPKTGIVQRFKHESDNPKSLSHNRVKSLLIDSKGKIWVGTNAGLNQLDPTTGKFTRYFHTPDDKQSLSSSFVFSLYEDIDSNLWIGTTQGLNRLSRQTRLQQPDSLVFDRFFESDGLPSNRIFSIQGDETGNIWIATDSGLARLLKDGQTVSFEIFDSEEDLQYANYLPKAHHYSKRNRRIFLGSDQGLLTIQTNTENSKLSVPHLMLSEVSRYNYEGGESTLLVDHFIANADKLRLTHQDRIVTFKFSDTNWDRGKTYEYQLKGFNEEWRKLPENMRVTFTDLAAGGYTLLARTRAADNKPLPSVQLLKIRVYPPWWRSNMAYLLYTLGVGGLIYFLYHFQLKRQDELREKKNLEILNEFKDTLYTNITHEFRTPLTVIGGVVEQVKGNEEEKELIRRNSATLLALVNQILGLRKLRSTERRLDLVQGDMTAFLVTLLQSLEALGKHKHITFQFASKESQLWMDFDQEKIQSIVTNLLSNAVKFTPENGQISLRLERVVFNHIVHGSQEAAQIEVVDSGIGLPVDQQEQIFGRFHQIKQDLQGDLGTYGGRDSFVGNAGSTGIGLSISKELVDLMGGEIRVKSTRGKGTTFTLLLPISNLAPKVDVELFKGGHPPRIIGFSEAETSGTRELPTTLEPSEKIEALSLLIIEDNADVVSYLKKLLEGKYELYIANDGEAGINMAMDKVPDLILSDVMMPKKDGFEVCDTLKNDVRTSHVPIVLLTAKAGVESRLTGLRRGADAYLAKPFNQEELFLTLANLAKLRHRLQLRYQTIPKEGSVHPIEATDAYEVEDAFMAKLTHIVEENMGDASFGTNELCRQMGLSRTNLHRKITALANISTSNFIRTLRLLKGKELLRTTDLNINEIAYDVGFNDPSYFSRKFVDEFGQSPSEFRRQETRKG